MNMLPMAVRLTTACSIALGSPFAASASRWVTALLRRASPAARQAAMRPRASCHPLSSLLRPTFTSERLPNRSMGNLRVFVAPAQPGLEPAALVAAVRHPVQDRVVPHQELHPPPAAGI